MESQRMGLMKKPMVVVPNHLLNQWKDAFYSLYPQADILVAEKSDFKKENREKLFAKVATGDWDAVIVAHSSFKKIGLPEETLNRILHEQIDDLTEAISALKSGGGFSFSVKEMEKTRERLKGMMARRAQTGTKDKAVSFADLGVDALVVDESQEFKNLYINTSLNRVAGLGNLAGSAKAFDLYVKCRYLQEKNNGQGVFFATGTPISNTIAEMYTIQRFLKYDELKSQGLAHFDAWASTFGQVVSGWELDATGVGYKLNNRFAKFQNVPELISLYRSFADVVTKKDLENQEQTRGLTPKIKGGRPQNVVVERSPLQARYMGLQEPVLDGRGQPILREDGSPVLEWTPGSIIQRMENLPKDARLDNPLKITNDARKCGLDYRLIEPAAPDFPGSKVNLAVENVFRLWQAWEADRGTQLVFCDLSTPKDANTLEKPPELNADGADEERPEFSMDELLASNAKFSVYDDFKAKLTAKGVPPDEIKFIHEAKTDLQKAKLFEDVNQGRVRVLLGFTAKMGAGTNVQERLVGLHHLDAPWRPSDLEQREGRIIRQGNLLQARDPENFEVEIFRYATKRTYDARMWQTIENKANGIEQFRQGGDLTRTIEDIASEAANAAEMKAAATGNELIFIQVKLAAELKKMEALYAAHQRGQHQLEKRIGWLEEAPGRAAKEKAFWAQEIAHRDQNTVQAKGFYFAAEGRIFDHNSQGHLANHLKKVISKATRQFKAEPAGQYRGFNIQVGAGPDKIQFTLKGTGGQYQPFNLAYPFKETGEKFSVPGFIQRLDNFLNKFEENRKEVDAKLEKEQRELATARQNQGRPFPEMDRLEALRRDNGEVLKLLRIAQKDPSFKSDWTPESLSWPPQERTELAAPKNPKPFKRADDQIVFIHIGDDRKR